MKHKKRRAGQKQELSWVQAHKFLLQAVHRSCPYSIKTPILPKSTIVYSTMQLYKHTARRSERR